MLLALVLSYLLANAEGQMSPYVVEGGYAKHGQFPYAACLNIQCQDFDVERSTPRSWRCGSSIVNQRVTLTAAHCLQNSACEDISIVVAVGHVNRHKGIMRSARSYHMHEEFNDDLVNDIALVRLRRPLSFSDSISRIALMPDPPYDHIAVVAGWGRTDTDKKRMPNLLKFAYYVALDDKPCVDILEELPKGSFCATTTGHGFIYNGDSGAALVVKEFIQIGITSYLNLDLLGSMAVFTDVGYHYDWIVETMKRISCDD